MREIIIALMHNPTTMVVLHGNKWSCKNISTIMNHICMVSIIGHIKPWGSLKTRTTSFIKSTELVLWSLGEHSELSDVGVGWEIICDLGKGSVNHSRSACSHISKWGYVGRDVWKPHREHSKNTLNCRTNAIFRGNLNFIFLSLWEQ